MFASNQVYSVHLEVTDKCNANCPMCARSHQGGLLNPRLRNIEMSLDLAKKIFHQEFVKQIRFLQMCGNFGDPIVAKDTVEILEYLRSVNPSIRLGIHTNGSLRTADWWLRLGQILSKRGDYCKFGIDGLEDTNHIYRQNTSWHRIMTSVESFIAGGGIAHWEYLVFKHNEHQIEEARVLAEKIGFSSFFVKKTSRFFNYHSGQNENTFNILNKNNDIVGLLELPSNENFVNPVTVFGHNKKATGEPNLDSQQLKLKSETSEPATKPNNDKSSEVDCMSIRDRSIYITAAGEVFPCCFLAGQIQYADRGPDGEYLENLTGGRENISAKNKSLSSLIDGVWFHSIANTWSSSTPKENRIGTCHRTCSKNQFIVKAEYE